MPLNVQLTAGEAHDSTCFEAAIDGVSIPQPVGRPGTRPKRVAGDKGYSCRRVRDWLQDHGIRGVIPYKDNEHVGRTDGRVESLTKRVTSGVRSSRT